MKPTINSQQKKLKQEKRKRREERKRNVEVKTAVSLLNPKTISKQVYSVQLYIINHMCNSCLLT